MAYYLLIEEITGDTANGSWKSEKCVYDAAMQCDVLIISPVYVSCVIIPELHKYVVILAQVHGNSVQSAM